MTMVDPRRPVAALSPALLARKGHARPAMRDTAEQLLANGARDALGSHAAADALSPAVLDRVAAEVRRDAKAAFTLRLDPDRHLRLRLASAVANRSAQQLVTEALDAFFESQPAVAELVSRLETAAPRE